jgi:hypothetical protein
MKPAATYEDVCAYMARMYYGDSGQDIPPGPNKKVRMVGLLFARPDVPLAQVEVVPNLDYFHYRSGKHIDFFCAGYDGYTGRDETEGYRKINKEPELKWGFSERMFIRFMEDIEGRSPWKYSGDCDLILANAHYDATKREVRIDLKRRVQCKLKQMKDIGAINSVTSFFEDIIRYAEHADGEDPTWGFSDAQGAKLAGSALRRFILALLPKDLGKDAERAVHFAVIDA